MAAGHLVAYVDLSLCSDIDSDDLVYSRREFCAVCLVEDSDIDYDALFAVRQLEGGVSDFLRFLTEDGAQHSCFRSEICLALRSQLTDEDVIGLDLCADPDDTFFVEFLEHVAREVRDIPCDLFRSELCISGFALVLLDVERCEYIVHEESFVKDDSVLVVVAFPCHESDQEVLSEGDLAHACGRTISYHFACFQMLTERYDRSLVDAGSLVGTLEFKHFVLIYGSVVVSCDSDVICIDVCDCTCVLAQNYSAGVTCCLVLDTCSDIRSFGNEQRNSLSLHVGTHQRTVSVVVLEERDHGRGYGYYLLRRNVHVVDFSLRHHGDLTLDASYGDLVVDEMSLSVERLVSLSNDHEVFVSCSEVLHLCGNDTLLLIDLAVRSLDESVLVDDPVSSKRSDKSDVRTFRSLDRAHSAVMRVMYVSDFHAGSFS